MQHISKLMQNFCISIQNDCWHKFYVSYCVSMQIFCIRGLKFVNIFKKFEILCKIFATIFNHFVSKFKIIVGFMWSKKSKQSVKKIDSKFKKSIYYHKNVTFWTIFCANRLWTSPASACGLWKCQSWNEVVQKETEETSRYIQIFRVCITCTKLIFFLSNNSISCWFL